MVGRAQNLRFSFAPAPDSDPSAEDDDLLLDPPEVENPENPGDEEPPPELKSAADDDFLLGLPEMEPLENSDDEESPPVQAHATGPASDPEAVAVLLFNGLSR